MKYKITVVLCCRKEEKKNYEKIVLYFFGVQ